MISSPFARGMGRITMLRSEIFFPLIFITYPVKKMLRYTYNCGFRHVALTSHGEHAHLEIVTKRFIAEVRQCDDFPLLVRTRWIVFDLDIHSIWFAGIFGGSNPIRSFTALLESVFDCR